ncbi:MAG: sigma-54-dependent transcriptional regulator [Candidatus Saccharibacteria bacterium]
MNILLVDDEQHSRKHLADMIRRAGHLVIEADDGAEAEIIMQPGTFHLVLTDNRMPRMSGLELLRRIREKRDHKTPAVVIMTAYGDVQTAIEALRAGAFDYLLKPVNIEELMILIERIEENLTLYHQHQVLNERFSEAVELATRQTNQELRILRREYFHTLGIDAIGVFSEVLQQIFGYAEKLHNDRSIPVLIEGETGTGKELLARYIHYGNNADVTRPFIAINCAAFNSSMIETELFGYDKGSFTGGLAGGKYGKFDLAQGGTLFLDEIAEMPNELQAKLLRVIEENEFYRVGGLKQIRTDVRIIGATNRDLAVCIENGTFRRDLYYRLNTGYLVIPPLRERKEAIVPMANMFLQQMAHEKGKKFKKISPSAAQMMMEYPWPGNIRQLKNVIEWVILMWDEEELKPHHIKGLFEVKNTINIATDNREINPDLFDLPPNKFDIEYFYDQVIKKALSMHGGNKTETAKYLGISRSSLYNRLKHIEQTQCG